MIGEEHTGTRAADSAEMVMAYVACGGACGRRNHLVAGSASDAASECSVSPAADDEKSGV